MLTTSTETRLWLHHYMALSTEWALRRYVTRDVAVTVEQVSRGLVELHRKGFDLGEVALRAVPGGYFSEDVSEYMGWMTCLSEAKYGSGTGLRLSRTGREILERELREAKSVDIETVRRARNTLMAIVDGEASACSRTD